MIYQRRNPASVIAVWHDGGFSTAHEAMTEFPELEVWSNVPDVTLRYVTEGGTSIIGPFRWIVRDGDGPLHFFRDTEFWKTYKKADD